MTEPTTTAPAAAPSAIPSPSSTEGVLVPATSAGKDAAPVVAPVAPISIADASKAFRASLTEAAKATPLAGPEDETSELDPNAGFDAPTQGADGLWRHKDGTFAPAPKVEGVQAAEAIPAPTEAIPEPVVAAEPAVEPIIVKLKARDGTESEIEVTDPAIADLLRANANDGLRRAEFNRKAADLEAGFAELNAFKQMVQENPEDVVLSFMKPEAQARLAEALIAQHWDALVERIIALDKDPSARTVVSAETKNRMLQQQMRLTEIKSTAQRAAQLERVVLSMVPDSVEQEVSSQFLADAAGDVSRAIQSGKEVTPENVKEILSKRVALYGFDKAESPTPTVAIATQPSTVARPAARAVAASAQTVDPAKAVARATQIAQSRSIAAAVAPAGAGAPTVRVPAVPQGATVEEASKHLRASLAGKSGW